MNSVVKEVWKGVVAAEVSYRSTKRYVDSIRCDGLVNDGKFRRLRVMLDRFDAAN